MTTEFQKRIIEYVKNRPNRMASRWEIAQGAFPEKWIDIKRSQGNRTHGRGALIAHIRRAAQTCEQLGRLPAKTQWDDDVIFYRDV
ncbi:MAG: hypothetical protein IPO08_22445 [Xanthomonadales bacterium]|nr:hypothetical protein [Xanthomonadales bacterium]